MPNRRQSVTWKNDDTAPSPGPNVFKIYDLLHHIALPIAHEFCMWLAHCCFCCRETMVNPWTSSGVASNLRCYGHHVMSLWYLKVLTYHWFMIVILRLLVSIHPRRTPGERSLENDPLDITWSRSASLNMKEINLRIWMINRSSYHQLSLTFVR